MRNKTSTISKRAHGVRRNSSEGIKGQRLLSARRISGSQRSRGSKGPTTGTHNTALLNPKLAPKRVLFINDDSIFNNAKYDPANIPKALETLYGELKKNPAFKDDKNWAKQPSLIDLKEYLLEEAEKLMPPHGSFSFGYGKDDKIELKYYKYIGELASSFLVPMEWINLIKCSKTRSSIIKTIALVQEQWDLDLIRSQWIDYTLDDESYMAEAKEQGEEGLLISSKTYKRGGDAQNMINEVNRSLKQLTKVKLEKDIKLIRARTPVQKQIKQWLLQGLEILNLSWTIDQYYFPNLYNNEDGDGINVRDMFGFAWSFQDLVFEHSEEHLNNSANQIGVIPPAIQVDFFVGNKTNEQEQAIRKLAKFMDAGRNIYFKHYNKHFEKHYKNLRYN